MNSLERKELKNELRKQFNSLIIMDLIETVEIFFIKNISFFINKNLPLPKYFKIVIIEDDDFNIIVKYIEFYDINKNLIIYPSKIIRKLPNNEQVDKNKNILQQMVIKEIYEIEDFCELAYNVLDEEGQPIWFNLNCDSVNTFKR